MARVIIVTDMTRLDLAYWVDADGSIIDFLDSRHEFQNFGGSVVVTRKRIDADGMPLSEDVDPADWDQAVEDLMMVYAVPAGVTEFFIALAVVVLSVAITLTLTPKPPVSVREGAPGSVYSVGVEANKAKLGDVIPWVAGTFERAPEYATQSYRYFENNQEIRLFLLTLTCGDCQIDGVKIGNTSVSDLPAGLVQYELYTPADHTETLGVIGADFGMHENVYTSDEVAGRLLEGGTKADFSATGTTSGGNEIFFPSSVPFGNVVAGDMIEITEPAAIVGTYTIAGVFTIDEGGTQETTVTLEGTGLASVTSELIVGEVLSGNTSTGGPFLASPGLETISRIELDIEWPAGLFRTNEDGSFANNSVTVKATVQEIDDAGDPVGSATEHSFTNVRATNTPQRVTYAIEKTPGRYTVKMERVGGIVDLSTDGARTVWTGLKGFIDIPSSTPAYGPVSLMAMKIIGAEAIGDAAKGQIKVKVTSVLPTYTDLANGGGVTPVATANPADLMAYIYTNADFGAGRPVSELDATSFAAFRLSQDGRSGFNGVFDAKTTVWDALESLGRIGRAQPFPRGNVLAISEDKARATRAGTITPDIIVSNGLKVKYGFFREGDKDGFRVGYYDPASFAEKTALFPADALDPEDVRAFGLTDPDEALGMAEYLWRNKTLRNITFEIETELDGQNLERFDRVGLAVPWLNWGDGYRVTAQSGLAVTLDRATPVGALYVAFRDQDGTASDVVSATGTGTRTIVLSAAPPITLVHDGRSEPTKVALGLAADFMQDVTIQSVKPSRRRTQIIAQNYVPTLWDDLP